MHIAYFYLLVRTLAQILVVLEQILLIDKKKKRLQEKRISSEELNEHRYSGRIVFSVIWYSMYFGEKPLENWNEWMDGWK